MCLHHISFNVLFGWGDLFLSPEIVKKWFPNITWQVDSYHFCSRGNKSNVLRKDFGPSNWAIQKDSMIAAVYAKTERECLVFVSIHSKFRKFNF